MLTLITYKREQYRKLKDSLEEKGYKLLSATELYDSARVLRINGEDPLAIDVSTLLHLYEPDNTYNNIAPILELLCHQMKDATLFIADEIVAEAQRYNARTLFDTIIESNVVGDNTEEVKCFQGVPIRITDLSSEELDELLEEFNNRLIGQEYFKKELRKQIKTFKLFNRIGEQPILSMLLLGSSGVGKTETARILSDLLAPDQVLPRINFGNYSSKDSLNSLIGSPRGYMGSENGELTMKIQMSKSGIVLVDEFEKADSAVWNFFLELLETGSYTDSLGEEHDLNGYIIVFTTNASKEEVIKNFPAELVSRFNLKTNFNPLSFDEKCEFIRFYINKIATKYLSLEEVPLMPQDIVDTALSEIDVMNTDNIRTLKNEARNWFANYVYEAHEDE